MELSEIAEFIKENQADALQANSAGPSGYTVVLDAVPQPSAIVYGDTPLNFSGRVPKRPEEDVPDQIREMRSLYEYENGSFQLKCKNFYRQGVFMQDYEDDAPWMGEFLWYFPTYQDLTNRQLRGYFSWRTSARKGEFRPIPASAAYLYVYELLNGIGTASPSESLEKLRAFEAGFLDSGVGDRRMRKNLHRWMLDFAVIHHLPPEEVLKEISSDTLRKDIALAALQAPEDHTDEEVFSALNLFSKEKLAKSPVVLKHEAEGRQLFCRAWRAGVAGYYRGEKNLFAVCFGEMSAYRWYPLANAVYYWRQKPEDSVYALTACRRYSCRRGVWTLEKYESLNFSKDLLQAFLHACDRKFRRYFKTGHYLPANEREVWAEPFAEEAIAADMAAKREAARPKISIDLSGLDRSRADALLTRDSLLTEEERKELEAEEIPAPVASSDENPELFSDREQLPLDEVQTQVLRSLLQGGNPGELIRSAHRTTALIADEINEALFDLIGDTVVSCEEEKLSLIEDYREDMEHLLRGSTI